MSVTTGAEWDPDSLSSTHSQFAVGSERDIYNARYPTRDPTNSVVVQRHTLGGVRHDLSLPELKMEEGRYVCRFDGCGKSFRRKEHLARHEYGHDPANMLKCAVCKREFNRKLAQSLLIFRPYWSY